MKYQVVMEIETEITEPNTVRLNIIADSQFEIKEILVRKIN